MLTLDIFGWILLFGVGLDIDCRYCWCYWYFWYCWCWIFLVGYMVWVCPARGPCPAFPPSSLSPFPLSPNFQAENIINVTVKLRWSWSSMEKSQPDLLLSKPGKQGNQSGNHQHKTRILHLTNLIFILLVVNCPTGWFLYLSLRTQISEKYNAAMY